MNMKKVIRKVAAVGAGLTMVGATLMGAMAANLNEYPAPFVQDGVFDAILVVGDGAAPLDIIGVTDIAMALQYSNTVEEPVESTDGTTTVEDGVVEKEQELGVAFAGDTYDDGDIELLQDSSIRYDSEDYDYEEQIIIGSSALTPESSEANEDFEGIPAVVVDAGTYDEICYKYQFDSVLAQNDSEELDIEFLGLDLTITSVGDDQVHLSTADQIWMDYGDELDVTIKDEDYNIKVGTVYDGEALITVNGVTESMEIDDVEDFDFEDFEIEMLNVLNDDGTENDAVKIKYGSTVSEAAGDGDAAEMLGYGDDDDEAEWVWAINSSTGNNIDYIGVCYKQDRTEIESELDEDWELPALFEGDKIMFPNDFAYVQYAATHFDNTYITASIEYDNSLTFSDDDSGDLGLSNDDAFVFDSGAEVWSYDGSEYEKFIVSYNTTGAAECNITVCMEDANGNKDCVAEVGANSSVCSWDELGLMTDDDELDINITWDGNAANSEISIITLYDVAGFTTVYTGDLVINASSNDGESDTNNEIYVDLSTDIDLTNVEENFLLDYGIIVNAPEGNLESGDYGKYVLQVPDEAVTVDLVFGVSEVMISGGSTTTVVNQIEIGTTKLASEVADITAQNAIVVGGPAVNMAAAELLGNPTQDEVLEMFTPGQAMVKLFDNDGNVAMLIAGYDGEDTRTACKVVANDGISVIDGMEAVVTTVSEEITAPTVVEEEEPEVIPEAEE